MEIIVQILAIGIPVITIIASAVAVFLFVKNKGTIDAQREAANTWQNLAESYQATNDKLEADMETLKNDMKELKRMLEVERKAFRVALDEIVGAFQRAESNHA